MDIKRCVKRCVCVESGFTLVEAVLAAGVLAVLVLVVLELSLHAWRIPALLGTRTNACTELRNAALWVERDLRRARDVDWAVPGSLSLVVWDAAGGWGQGTVTYELQDGVLVRDDMGWRRVVARGLERADFSAEERDGGVFVTAVFTDANGNRVNTGIWVFTGEGG